MVDCVETADWLGRALGDDELPDAKRRGIAESGVRQIAGLHAQQGRVGGRVVADGALLADYEPGWDATFVKQGRATSAPVASPASGKPS